MSVLHLMKRGTEAVNGAGITLAVIMSLLSCPAAFPQVSGAQIEIVPSNPTSNDSVTVRISGTWSNGCVPQSPNVSVSGFGIRIETSNPGSVCTMALTAWALTVSVGELRPGDYSLVVTYSGPGVPSPYEIGRKAFSVAASSAANEVILPIVVNGSFADKLHYQTIFTVLNSTMQSVRATLQVFGNSGTPRGVFCSPLAPPPSSASFTLNPGAQYFQFTSADLPYLDGWARLTWEGPSSLLASEELTLVAAAPSPCLLVCNRPSSEKLSSTQISAVRAARSFQLPVTLNRYRQTGLAIINPSTTEVNSVRVSILDASGNPATLGASNSFELKLGPQERVTGLLWQMVLEHSALTALLPVPEGFQGSVLVTAERPFAVGALNIMFPEGKFVSVPTSAGSR
jgi:hypothetical protein